MKKITVLIAAVLMLLCASSVAADKKLIQSQLPVAVRKAAEDQSKGATVVGYSSEVENGKKEYEVALKVDGHSKDVSFDSSGNVIEVEEEVAMASLSPDVQEGLKKAAGSGTLGKVESLTKGNKLVAYEAKVRKGNKRSEVQVGPNGEKLAHEE